MDDVCLSPAPLAASVVYNALFVLLSVVTSRAIAAGLLYLLVWEGLLGNLVGGVRLLSVDQRRQKYRKGCCPSRPQLDRMERRPELSGFRE